jgi:hypothetical protein
MEHLINRNPNGATKLKIVTTTYTINQPSNTKETIKEKRKDTRYATNQEYREKAKSYTRARYNEMKEALKAKKDPEEVKQRNATYYRRKCDSDPDYLKKRNAYNRALYRKNHPFKGSKAVIAKMYDLLNVILILTITLIYLLTITYLL